MSAHTVHIERKDRDPTPAAAQLRERLLGRKRAEVTVADAAAISGLPLDLAEPALMTLASAYPARVRVTEAGDLLFRFDSLVHARDRPPGPLRRLADAIRERAARWRDVIFAVLTIAVGPALLIVGAANAWSVVDGLPEGALRTIVAIPTFLLCFGMFTVGVVAFVLLQVFPFTGVLMIALGVIIPILVAVEGFDGVAGALVMLALAGASAWFGWALCASTLPELWRMIRTGGNRWSVRLWRNFGGFVLGPLTGARSSPLADERALTALIRRRRGVVTRADLVGLFGWSWDDADREVTRVLCDYGGDVVVTEDGGILYVFDALMRTTASLSEPELDDGWARARLGARPRLFDCDGVTRNALLAVSLLALVGLLVHADLRLFPDADHYRWLGERQHREQIPPYVLMQAGGVWPYLLLLGLPALRAPLWLRSVLAWRRRRAEVDASERIVAGEDPRYPVAEEAAAAAALRAEREAHDPAQHGIVGLDVVYDSDLAG